MPSAIRLTCMRCWLRARLIADWRRGWRFWSVRLEALALASGAWLLGAPDLATQLWLALPPETRAVLPHGIGRWLPFALGLLALAARFIKQKGLRDD